MQRLLKRLDGIVSVYQNKKLKRCSMRTFNHLTQEERYHIYIMHKKIFPLKRLPKIWVGINPLSVESRVEIRETAGIVISKHTSKPRGVIFISLKRSNWMRP